MIQATELKTGTTFQIEGKPYKVVKYTHTKIGRGGANVSVSVRNLETGDLKDLTFNSGHRVEEISTSKKSLQYLYSDGSYAIFMDPKTFEQTEIPVSIIGEELKYTKEGGNVDVLFWSFGGAQDKDDKPLSLAISPKASLKIVETAPGIKGNTASNAFKPAILENGLEVKVPLFINQGEKIVVDTRTGEYVERVKNSK